MPRPNNKRDSYYAKSGQVRTTKRDQSKQLLDVRGTPPVPLPSALDFGAAGDGVTNDSAVFKIIEADPDTGPAISLSGRTFALTSDWADPVNGVALTKDYVGGQILMDGRPYAQDLPRGLAAAEAFVPPQVITDKPLGLLRQDENTYFVWSPLGDHYWHEIQVSRAVPGVPFNWQGEVVRQKLAIVAARDGATHSYSGSWATDTASTALTTADGVTYIGGRAQQALAVGDYVDITYEFGGDVFIIFSARTLGNFINVLIDGSQEHLVLPDDGAGNRYFDSYSPVDLQHRQIVKVASDVPFGLHTIRLQVSPTRSVEGAGGRYLHNAMAFADTDTGPWTPETDARPWQSNEAVLNRQVRQHQGRYYYANADGTTGTTPPTHTVGTVSDGGVPWVFRAVSGYDLPSHRIQAQGSQLEYAYEIQPTGATAKEDVGGRLHGNEAQTSFAWTVDGDAVILADKAWAIGDTIVITENLDVTHSQIGGGTVPVVRTELRREFEVGKATVAPDHTVLVGGLIGYFYGGMWPLLHYAGIGAKYAITEVWTPGDGWRDISDFYGVSGNAARVGRTKDFVAAARGPLLQPDGVAGVPSSAPAPFTLLCALRATPESVDSYQQDGIRNFMFWDMNTSGADVSAGGYSSMTTKLYLERNSGTAQQYQAGDVIRSRVEYFVAMEPA